MHAYIGRLYKHRVCTYKLQYVSHCVIVVVVVLVVVVVVVVRWGEVRPEYDEIKVQASCRQWIMSHHGTRRCFFAGIARHLLRPYADPLRMLLGRNGSRRGTIPFWTLIHALRALTDKINAAPWRIARRFSTNPSTNLERRLNYYLTLSGIRLNCFPPFSPPPASFYFITLPTSREINEEFFINTKHAHTHTGDDDLYRDV